MARKLKTYSRTCPLMSRARAGPMPRVQRVDRARPGPIRGFSVKKTDFHGATLGFRITEAHAS